MARSPPEADSAQQQRVEEDLARRLQVVLKGSKENSVQVSVRDALYDTSTAEGCTRHHFIQHFDARQQGLAQIRQWVEGMHEYLLEKRAVDLYFIYTGADRELCDTIRTIEDIDVLSLVTISFLIFTIVEQVNSYLTSRHVINAWLTKAIRTVRFRSTAECSLWYNTGPAWLPRARVCYRSQHPFFVFALSARVGRTYRVRIRTRVARSCV